MARITKRPGTSVPYARKVVPKDVRGLIGRSEFKRPLDGATPSDRRRQHAELMQGWEAQIAAARAEVRGELRSLTLREIDALCGEWYRAELQEHEDDPADAASIGLTLETENAKHPGHGVGEPPPDFDPRPDELEQARQLLRAHGIAADARSLARTAERLWETELRFWGTLLRRAQGDWSQDQNLTEFPEIAAVQPKVSGSAVGGAPGLTFSSLLDAWAAERTPAAATRKRYRIAFAHVARVSGLDDPRAVALETVRSYKAARLAEGRNPETVADEIMAAGSVFTWGVKNGLLPSNPFAGLAPRPGQRGPSKREGYTDAEAARVLQAARQETGWKRWLPWLLCFTGARIGELADLRRRDVQREAGVWILDVVPTAERAGKNSGFRRMLPLHSAVIAEGFLDYAAALPADGPLFPDLVARKDGSRAGTATTNLARWIRGVVGIEDATRAPAHSFRHRMEDELRRARVAHEAADALMGHNNPRNAGAGYGRGFRGMPDEVLKELERVPSPLEGQPPASLAAAD